MTLNALRLRASATDRRAGAGAPKAAVLRHKHLVSYILGSVEFAAAEEAEEQTAPASEEPDEPSPPATDDSDEGNAPATEDSR